LVNKTFGGVVAWNTGSATLSRRAWLGLVGAGFGASALAAVSGCGTSNTKQAVTLPPGPTFATESPRRPIDTPEMALTELQDGNQRFVNGLMRHPGQTPERRRQLSKYQEPFAVVLTCSDSRCPAEVLFDQGLGDLFVIRVAGNIIGSAVLGSVEYALDHLGTPLVMVLGHQNCGAVTATLESIRDNTIAPGDVKALVDAITPAVAIAEQRPGDLLDNTIRVNAERSRDTILSAPELKSALDKREVKVVAAYYSLDSGIASVI
jgi:carbonic anhydrase